MNHRIKLLSDHDINKIAAGEVVERPVSVVKELLENSLDAHATAIEIIVEGDGTSFIKIQDNGQGIATDDLKLAILPHATSKISRIEDLESLETMGFRGEALPSIVAVSKVSILSRPKEQISGCQLDIEGGIIHPITEKGCPVGTIITIKDLFYNTPARKKFIRTASSEFGAISDLVSRLALARPDVSFTLRHPKKLVLHTSGRGDLLETIAAVLGKEIAQKMVPVNYETNGLKIHGYVSLPELVKSSRNAISFFVNRRWIRSALLNQALKEGYHTLVPSGMHPMVVLSILMPPADFDVNVHPAKLEIKFRDEKLLINTLSEVIRKNIIDHKPLKHFFTQTPTKDYSTFGANHLEHSLPRQEWKQLNFIYQPLPTVLADTKNEREEPLSTATDFNKFIERIAETIPSNNNSQHAKEEHKHLIQFETLKAVGQIFQTFILATDDQSLYIIDQHAAHERCRYDEIHMAFSKQKISSQALLIPESIELSNSEEQILLYHLQELADLGFTVEHFGERTYLLRSVPQLYHLENPSKIFREFLAQIVEFEQEPSKERLFEEWIFMLACRSSIKAKDYLTVSEMDDLIQSLKRTANPYTCPHGRPVILEISKKEILKKFHR